MIIVDGTLSKKHAMEYVRIPGLNQEVSRICFGAEPLGGTDWGNFDEAMAISSINRAIELGINFFDTADVYGLGKSETRLADALGDHRHNVVIATKFGVNWVVGESGERARTFLDGRQEHVFDAVNASLQRLQLKSIPLYLVHWPDPNTPMAETFGALNQCKKEGKVQAVGLSNFSLEQVKEASCHIRIDAVQLSYSLIAQEGKSELFSYCRHQNIPIIAYGTLAQGLLTGKYLDTTTFDKTDRRHRLSHFKPASLRKNLRIVSELMEVGSRYGKSPAQVAIRWVLDNPNITSAIVGAKTPAQIEHNISAAGWKLLDADYHYLSRDREVRCDRCEY